MNFRKIFFLSWFGVMGSFSHAAMEFKEAEITTLKNMVEHNPGSGAAPAKVNEKIGENSKVTTAAASMAELTFADTSITRLGANSLFSFQSKERLIKLEKGSVLVNTPPGNGGATVDCGGVTGAVSGTTFLASRDGAGNVMFLMLEGSGTLKVTVPTPGGGFQQKEIRPGQAATVGSASISPEPGAAGSPPKPEPAAAGGDGEKKGSAPAPAIQVFEVDVKKIVETAPLIREFKNELPSIEKIEKTIETQQTAVREGKMEKLEVEVVAVKKDGDVLVGAPKVEKEEMVVVNSKEQKPMAGNRDNLDIDTAAGPGAGGGPGADARPIAAAPPPPPAPSSGPGLPAGPLSGVIGQTANQVPREGPPTVLKFVLSGNTGVVSLDRMTREDRLITFTGFDGLPTDVLIRAGTPRTTFAVEPRNLFPGFVSTTDPALKPFAVTATSLTLSDTIFNTGMFPTTILSAANPARDFMETTFTRISWNPEAAATAYELTLGSASPILIQAIPGGLNSFSALGTLAAADVNIRALTPTGWVNLSPGPVISDNSAEGEALMKVLDAFFYFQAASPSAEGQPGPSQWFAGLNGSRSLADGTVAGGRRGDPIALGMTVQDFDFYAAGAFTATPADQSAITVGTAPEIGILVQNQVFAKTILYADRINLGVPTGTWAGLSAYDGTTAPDVTQPLEMRWAGYLGQFSDFGEPNGLVWDDLTGNLANGFKLFADTDVTGMTLAAGRLGFQARGMDWVGNGSYGLEINSVADVEMVATRIRNVGASPGTEGSSGLKVEAKGKVKLGGAVAEDQVRLEAAIPTDAGTTGPQNLAVIRTGNSLELRNVVIRNFDGTRLEKITTAADGTQTMAGRVLVSGSSVRDFKIKELVGAAVNADAKIQMMAMSDNGILAGEMMVQGSLPVATKLASALAATDEILPTATASAQVHAKEIDLAADRITLNGATMTAMNSIAVRANTLIVQNSFMTVVRNSGMINMYVQQGLVNQNFGTVVPGQANFAGNNTFQIGSLPAIVINNKATLDAAYGTRLFDTASPVVGGTPQVGAINVLRL